MLQRTRLDVLLARSSHHSFWETDKPWVGGTQLDTVKTVCACAKPLKPTRVAAVMAIKVLFI
jgi:hypothetical protein